MKYQQTYYPIRRRPTWQKKTITTGKGFGAQSRWFIFYRYTRYNCLVAVDYDVNEWAYQCFMRDISLGGAYVETNQKISIGQKMALTLSAPGQPQCPIKGVVVRRDKMGVGIQFNELSSEQKSCICKLIKSDVPLKRDNQA